MDPTFVMAAACGIIGLAAWTLTLWWLRDPQQAAARPPARHPMDHEPHTLTVLGRDGRLNPLQYERLPSYAAAQARQRELAHQGKASVIAHAESGQIRMDLAAWLGPYARIGF